MTRGEFFDLVGREEIQRLARASGTPAYLYFLRVVRKRHADLVGCLPRRFDVYYAVKANPHPGLLRQLGSMGIGADVASIGELEAAISQGIPPERVEFSGPGKTESEIAKAIQHGVSSINAESLAELDIIARASVREERIAQVGIRLNPGVAPTQAGLRMSGATQFGIQAAELEQALRFIRSNDRALRFTGLHVHTGSQILSSEAVAENFRSILELALLTEDLGLLPLQKINFGGGWGISYFPHQAPLDLADLSSRLADLFNDSRYASLKTARHIVEPGRFLVGESGVYVTTVLYRKPGARREFLIVDGGMHQHYLLAGGMGQVIRRNFELDYFPVFDRPSRHGSTFDVAGCLCTPQDLLATDVLAHCDVCPGDHIVFFNSGAYGLTASPLLFLGHRLAAETALD